MYAQSLPGRIGVRAVLEVSWPICISMLAYTAMTVVNSIFVGHLGTGPLAAIGLSAALVHATTAFGHGLIGGMRVCVARTTGAEQRGEGLIYAWQGNWLALALGFACLPLAWAGPTVFAWMGASGEVAAQAQEYFGLRTLGSPFVFAYLALASWFQGRGDTRSPMVAAIVANGLNIVVDPVLIFGWGPFPEMGIRGAAVGTIAGMAAGAGLLAWWGSTDLLASWVGPSWRHQREIWSVGAPTGLQNLLDVASFGVFASLLAGAGDAQLAAHVVVVRIAMVSFLPGYAIGEASGVLVGQAMGAGRPALARDAHRAATKIAVVLMLAFALVFALLPGPLVAAFGAAPDVAAVARTTLLIAAALQVIDAVGTVAFGSLSGAGDTRYVLGATVIATWLFKVPAVALLVAGLGLGAPGAWLGLMVEVAVIAAAGAWRIRGDAWLADLAMPLPAK